MSALRCPSTARWRCRAAPPVPCVGAGSADGAGALDGGTGGREDAADRHVGEQPEHDQREQRAQIPAAGARQVAARAAAGKHHAEAEHQPADDMPDPAERRCHVHRFVEGDDAGPLQELRADQRGGRRQDPRAKPPPVAEVQNVGERSHRAVVGAEHDGPEQEAQHQPADAQSERAVAGQKFAQGIHASRDPPGPPLGLRIATQLDGGFGQGMQPGRLHP